MTRRDKERALKIARKSAPFDTGNLRQNAIKLIDKGRGNGFSIIYDTTEANYIIPLNEGSKYFTGHKGFVDRTFFLLDAFVAGATGSSKDRIENRERIKEQLKALGMPYSMWRTHTVETTNTPQRVMRNLRSHRRRETETDYDTYDKVILGDY
jgi:hypothetical protein